MFFILLLIFLLCDSAYPLVPLASLSSGNFSDYEISDMSNPLNFIFQRDKAKKKASVEQKDKLKIYHGFYKEGKNLEHFCQIRPEVFYPTAWDREQSLRGIAATTQLIGLQKSIPAIAYYAKSLNFNNREYTNLTNGIVNNYCSKNISVMSLRDIKSNLLHHFKAQTSYALPSIRDNPLFPYRELRLSGPNQQKILAQEFKTTIKLFRALCSWGSNTQNYRLMVPLLRDQVIMSFIFRQIEGIKLNWDHIQESLYLQEGQDTVKVACQNLICRNRNKHTFSRMFPRGIGTRNIGDDLKRLYCMKFRDLDYTIKGQEEQVKKWILKRSVDSDNHLSGQFLALLTNVPNFLLHSLTFAKLKNSLRATVDKTWNDWAVVANRGSAQNIYFEELLSFEVATAKTFSHKSAELKVVVDINLGESDRASQRRGKIAARFQVKFLHKYLKWIRESWVQTDASHTEKREIIIANLSNHLKKSLDHAKSRFVVPLWQNGLDRLIVQNILLQLQKNKKDFWDNESKQVVSVPIEFRFGIFALKYIGYKLHFENQ